MASNVMAFARRGTLDAVFMEAVQYLMPFFDASYSHGIYPFHLSQGIRNAYDPESGSALISPDQIGNEMTVGKLAATHIHFRINPDVRRMQSETGRSHPFADQLVDCVAHYGGILNSTRRGKRYVRSDIRRIVPDLGLVGTADRMTAYARAEYLFDNYGHTKLPEVSRMSVEEADQHLPRMAPVGFYERTILPLADKTRDFMRAIGRKPPLQN